MSDSVRSELGAGGSTTRTAPAEPSWPGGVPPLEVAIQLLRRSLPPPDAAAQVCARVQAGFSDIEEDALQAEGLPFDAGAFREALGTRLQLAFALEHAAHAAEAVDRPALDMLLGQTDGALVALRAYEGQQVQPAVLARIHATRDVLVRDAVKLSQLLVPEGAAPEPAATPSAASDHKPSGKHSRAAAGISPPERRDSSKPHPAEPPRAHSPEKARSSSQTRRLTLRERCAVTAATLVVVAGIAFHLAGAQTPRPPPPTVPGAPEGVMVVQDPRGGMLVRTLDGKIASPEVVRWVQGYEAQGFEVRLLGPGTYALKRRRAPADIASSPQ